MKKSREFPFLMYFIEDNIQNNTNGLEPELVEDLKVLISFYNNNKKNQKNQIVNMLKELEKENDLLLNENSELKKKIDMKNQNNQIINLLKKLEEENDILINENTELKKKFKMKNEKNKNFDDYEKEILEEKKKFEDFKEEKNLEIKKLKNDINLLKIDNELNLKKLLQKNFVENELKFEQRKNKELENEKLLVKNLIKKKVENFEEKTKSLKEIIIKKKEECEILRKNYKNTYKKKLKYKKYNENLKNILNSNDKLIKSLKDEKVSYEENSKKNILKESFISENDQITIDFEKRGLFEKDQYLMNKKKTLKFKFNKSCFDFDLGLNKNSISFIEEKDFYFENKINENENKLNVFENENKIEIKRENEKKEKIEIKIENEKKEKIELKRGLVIEKDLFFKFLKILKNFIKSEKNELISFNLNKTEEEKLLKDFENLKEKNFENFLEIIFKPFTNHIFYLESKIENFTQLNSYYLLKLENIKEERDHILNILKKKDIKSQGILNLKINEKNEKNEKKKINKFKKKIQSERNIFSNDIFNSSIEERISSSRNIKIKKDNDDDGLWNKMSNFLF